MTEALALIKDPRTYLLLLLIFGVLPRFTLRLLVRMFPRGHPRRKELVGELAAIDYPKRPLFVAEQLEVCVCEGIPARWQDSRWAYLLAGRRWGWETLPCQCCGVPAVDIFPGEAHPAAGAASDQEVGVDIILCCWCLGHGPEGNHRRRLISD